MFLNALCSQGPREQFRQQTDKRVWVPEKSAVRVMFFALTLLNQVVDWLIPLLSSLTHPRHVQSLNEVTYTQPVTTEYKRP